MSLETFHTRVQQNRDLVGGIHKSHSDEESRINNDTSVSETYRAELKADLNRTTKQKLVELAKAETGIIKERISDLEKTLDANTDFTSGGIIALRDAQDRVDAIKPDDGARALRLMERSIRQNDTTLAHALYRRAAEAGWTDVSAAFIDAYPEHGELMRDLSTLQNLLNQSFERNMNYATFTGA